MTPPFDAIKVLEGAVSFMHSELQTRRTLDPTADERKAIAAMREVANTGRRVTAAFRALGESRSLVPSITTMRAECEAAMLALEAALAAFPEAK